MHALGLMLTADLGQGRSFQYAVAWCCSPFIFQICLCQVFLGLDSTPAYLTAFTLVFTMLTVGYSIQKKIIFLRILASTHNVVTKQIKRKAA